MLSRKRIFVFFGIALVCAAAAARLVLAFVGHNPIHAIARQYALITLGLTGTFSFAWLLVGVGYALIRWHETNLSFRVSLALSFAVVMTTPVIK